MLEVVPILGLAQKTRFYQASTPAEEEFDYEYFQRRFLPFDCRIVCMTAAKFVLGEGIRH